MSITSSILERDLKKTDWKELAELFTKYPYSQTITSLLSEKAHFENNISMDNPGRRTFMQANNPGIQYANLLRHLEEFGENSKKMEQASSPLIKKEPSKNLSEGITQDSWSPGPAFAESDSKMTTLPKKQSVRNKPGFPPFQSDFTKWVLKQGTEKTSGPAFENEETPIGNHTKTVDSNQLKDEIVSEPLAALYAQQGLIKEAIEMYTKLSLKIPNKSTYFAEIIKKLKKSN